MFSIDLAMHNLIKDIIDNCAYFQQIELDRVIISTKTSIVPGSDGIYAQLFPLKYKNGANTGVERIGRRLERYRAKPIYRGRKEILYILYFYVPRFLNLSFIEKITTVFHELYHISAEFNGDIRRFPGRNFMHGNSIVKYDSLMAALAKDYLFRTSNLSRSDFLRFGSRSVQKKYGTLILNRVSEPESIFVGTVKSKRAARRKRK